MSISVSLGFENTQAEEVRELTRDEFAAFFAETSPALRGYVRRVTANPALADDIVQESFVRVLTAKPMAPSHRKWYLYRVASNLIIDQQRGETRHRHWWQRAPRRHEAVEARMELRSDMEKLFAEASVHDRALLWLAYVEQASHRDIAGILRMTESSVKTALFRARERMRAILQAHGVEGSNG